MVEETRGCAECLHYHAVSDVGMRRANNQDAYSVALSDDLDGWESRGHLFLVADGMGAHVAGEKASKMAADGIPLHYQKFREESAPEALRRAIMQANTEIHRMGQENVEFHNMGTTASALILLPQGGFVAHAGDSRVYRLRDESLEQLTFDHSLVWELRAQGQLSQDLEASGAIPKNVITRSLGPSPNVQVDVEGPFPLEVGDTFLLCSDGLTARVEDAEIGPILANLPPQEATQLLVDLANLRGGPDNITVIVTKVVDDAITTRANAAKPIRVGEAKVPLKIDLGVGILFVLCLLTTLTLFALEQSIGGMIMIAATVIVAIFAAMKILARPEMGKSLGEQYRLGKGPYSRTDGKISAEFLDMLETIVRELRQVIEDRQWYIQWEIFDTHHTNAVTLKQEKRFSDSLGSYWQAIAMVMQEWRTYMRKRESIGDHHIDL